jgi:hypothetical protein
MSEWFNEYSLCPDFENPNISNYLDIIKNNTKNNEDDVLQTKVEQIETDYLINLKQLEEMCVNTEEIHKFKTKNSLVILQKEHEIIKLLTKYSLQNNILDYDFFINVLNFLLELSEILRNRINQKEIVHDAKFINNSISRCSYKFCNYKDACVYNYNLKNKSQCYQDHYVHRMVSADLSVLIDYIKSKYSEQKTIIPNKEILKSINTLSYVINHMETELKSKCMFLDESEWEKNHFVKNFAK